MSPDLRAAIDYAEAHAISTLPPTRRADYAAKGGAGDSPSTVSTAT